uniref:Uncharacterized protein n=1 Tax=Stegastes partitus TaxID=144197 RepID=A0A3B5B5D1_9TELE
MHVAERLLTGSAQQCVLLHTPFATSFDIIDSNILTLSPGLSLIGFFWGYCLVSVSGIGNQSYALLIPFSFRLHLLNRTSFLISLHRHTDDAQSYLSHKLNYSAPLFSLHNCLSAIKGWMLANLLQLNSSEMKMSEHVCSRVVPASGSSTEHVVPFFCVVWSIYGIVTVRRHVLSSSYFYLFP